MEKRTRRGRGKETYKKRSKASPGKLKSLGTKASGLTARTTQNEGEVDAVVAYFGSRLEDPDLTDQQARSMFYDIAHGVTEEIETALFESLGQRRPQVASAIREELKALN